MTGGVRRPHVPPTTRVTASEPGDVPLELYTPDTDTDSDPVATSTAVASTPSSLTTVSHSSRLPARHDDDVVPMDGVNTTTADALVGDEKLTIMTSPTLYPGVTGTGLKAVTETTPGQQAVAPAVLPSKGAHATHEASLEAATAALYVPAGHATQAAADTVPVVLEYRPAGHGCRGPPSQK
jgi:hypothetical protein